MRYLTFRDLQAKLGGRGRSTIYRDLEAGLEGGFRLDGRHLLDRSRCVRRACMLISGRSGRDEKQSRECQCVDHHRLLFPDRMFRRPDPAVLAIILAPAPFDDCDIYREGIHGRVGSRRSPSNGGEDLRPVSHPTSIQLRARASETAPSLFFNTLRPGPNSGYY